MEFLYLKGTLKTQNAKSFLNLGSIRIILSLAKAKSWMSLSLCFDYAYYYCLRLN